MNELTMAGRIAELEQQLAAILERLENSPPTLPQALELHAKWLAKEPEGVRLDLSGANLRESILRGVDLNGADLTDATGVRAFADREEKRGEHRAR
jgi:uncharacterized protein YjbI with pentapeptide repeats